MPLHPALKSGKDYEQPTEIQDKTIGMLLKRQDMPGMAQMATGETAALLIPVINRLLTDGRNFRHWV